MDTISQKASLIEKVEKSYQDLLSAKKTFYSQHLYEFQRDVLAWPDLYEPLHRKVCDFIHDNVDKKKILLLLPRGTFKSSVVTVGYSLYRIANNPNDRILIANATYPMATQFLSQIKNHIQKNETFKTLFGDMSSTSESWREDRISIAREKSYEQKEPTVWAVGGGNIVGSHFNIAILDDLVARENIGTKDQIERIKSFYKDVLDIVDASPTGHKKVIVIGTTWHWDDLYSWIQEEDNHIIEDFAVMRLPAFTGEWNTGQLLFPKRLGWETLKKLREQQGSTHFAAQYMLNPVPEETATFKGQFKYYEETDIRGLHLNKFITIDPAASEDKSSDFSTMVCVGVDANNDWYILDLWREQCLPKRLIDQIFYWDDKWKPMSIGIETTAFQKTLQYFIYDQMKQKNHYIPLKELTHTQQSKDQRITGLQPRFETNSIFLNKYIPFTDYLEDELRRFPKSKNDDLIDALASQLELAFPVKDREERKQVRRNIYPA
jgi:hypothetical protein